MLKISCFCTQSQLRFVSVQKNDLLGATSDLRICVGFIVGMLARAYLPRFGPTHRSELAGLASKGRLFRGECESRLAKIEYEVLSLRQSPGNRSFPNDSQGAIWGDVAV